MEKVDCVSCDFKSPATQSLDNKELGILSNNCAKVQFRARETIFKQDVLSSNIVYVQSGIVKVHMQGPERDSIIKILKPPAYLGIPTSFGDKVNHYSATALTKTTVCFIDINAFKEFIYRNGRFAYEILLDRCKKDLDNFHRCVNLTQKQLNGRIADALISFADNFFENDKIEMILTRIEFADLVGTSRESISRVLNLFHEEGIISMSGKKILLKDRKSLERISRTG